MVLQNEVLRKGRIERADANGFGLTHVQIPITERDIPLSRVLAQMRVTSVKRECASRLAFCVSSTPMIHGLETAVECIKPTLSVDGQ